MNNEDTGEPTADALGVVPSAPWPSDAICDRLTGNWNLWQRKKGHRTSTDDLLTAFYAARWAGSHPPDRYLDLGCGIGSVLLQTAYVLRPLQSFGVEAQAQSATMARRSVRELPEGAPAIAIRHGDLRAMDTKRAGRFALITGSPPYLPIGTGTPSADVQRHACRFELRGGVEAYADIASQLLADNGLFVLVFQTTWEPRVLAAGARANLHLHARARVFMRTGDSTPFLGVYAWRKEGPPPEGVLEESLTVRQGAREWTQDFMALRAYMGLDGSNPTGTAPPCMSVTMRESSANTPESSPADST